MSQTPSDVARRRRKWLTGLVQLVLVAVVLGAAYGVSVLLSSQKETPTSKAAEDLVRPVRVVEPETGTFPVRVETTGTVAARTIVNVTPQVGGRVIEVSPHFEAGGSFDAGETLFRIDPSDYQVALELAQSQLADARARLEKRSAKAENDRKDWKRVYPDRAVPRLVAGEHELEALRAEIIAREAQIDDARLDLQRTRFSLPFDGRVLSSDITVGQVVAANQAYGRVYDIGTVEITAALKPEEWAALKPLEGRTGTAIATDKVQGERAVKIVTSGAELNAATRTLNVRLHMMGEAPFLPGTFVDLRLNGPDLQNVMSFPISGLAIDDTVWLVEAGKLAHRPVEVLSQTQNEVVAARFDAGEGVVVSPLYEPAEGDDVRIIGDHPASANMSAANATAAAGADNE